MCLRDLTINLNIPPMNKSSSLILLAFVLTCLLTTPAHVSALPVGTGSHPGEYLVSAEDLNEWYVGAYMLDRKRDVRIAHSYKSPMYAEKTMVYVGYEFLYGLIGYGTFGSTETRFSGSAGDSSSEYGGGIHLNIMHHEIPDPTLPEDRFTIDSNLQYTKSSGQWGRRDVEWDEWYGSLTFTFINNLEGNKFYNPNSLGFFFGAAFSDLQTSSFQVDSPLGYTAGVIIFYSENVTIEIGVEGFDYTSSTIGLHVRL
jgi:hypothetical protein